VFGVRPKRVGLWRRYALASGLLKKGFLFSDHGDLALRGFEDPSASTKSAGATKACSADYRPPHMQPGSIGRGRSSAIAYKKARPNSCRRPRHSGT
jgi:hypothetical protein